MIRVVSTLCRFWWESAVLPMVTGEYSYDVLDGFPIHEEHTRVYPVRPGEEVVLASDGYPELFGSLAESEAVIREVKETDPMCMFRLKDRKE